MWEAVVASMLARDGRISDDEMRLVPTVADAAARFVERYLSAPLITAQFVSILHPTSATHIVLEHKPITAVIMLERATMPQGPWSAIAAQDYTIDTSAGVIMLKAGIDDSYYRATYTAGFGTTPQAVPQALQWCVARVARAMLQEGLREGDGATALYDWDGIDKGVVGVLRAYA